MSDGKLGLVTVKPDTDDRLLTLITPEQASALIAKSNGSPFFGGARDLFSISSDPTAPNLASPVDHPERIWHPLPPLPSGSTWSVVDVAPDQQHLAAFAESTATPGAGTLWLFQIAPRTTQAP